jgi:hypothetical protein
MDGEDRDGGRQGRNAAAADNDQDRNENLTSQMEGMYVDCWEDENHLNFQNNTEGSSGQNSSDSIVDRVIGELEDIVIKPSFQTLYNAFLDSNYTKFKRDDPTIDDDQNFDIFSHYSCTIGTYLENELKKRISKTFDMEEFISKIRGRNDLMENEIIEMIFTLLDYAKFNELISDYSSMKADNGQLANLIASGITVTKLEPPPSQEK